MATTSETRLDLRRLRLELAGEVIGPDEAAYDAARTVFVPTIDRRPAAIVRPVDDDAVAAVVALAQEEGLELAVRGGGHSYAGHGVSDGGLVLDLGWLDAIHVDVDGRVATVEAGLTAAELTKAVGEHGLGIGLGDTGTVGVGGLTLGGGVGYLARKHGLTIDNLLGADVVTADGSVLSVDADNHADLFWAIRGGGGNFGVVTRFRYRLNPVEGSFGGMLVLPATPDTIAGFVQAADEAPEELTTIANVMPAPPLQFLAPEHHGRLVVLGMLFYAGPAEAAQAAVAPFRALAEPLADLLRPLSYGELYPPEQGEQMPLAAGRALFTDTVDRAVAAEIVGRLTASTALMPVVQLRVLGGAVARVPEEATAYAHRSRRVMANVAAIFANRDDRPVHEAWVEEFAASLRSDDAAYVNFLGDEGPERVRAAYPGRAWDRLREIKRRYDPENVFHLNQNIEPAREAA
jgi:FAD/FMN-containing dehydrogenase